eukprot:7033639-Karenia_brevis.AAC.1
MEAVSRRTLAEIACRDDVAEDFLKAAREFDCKVVHVRRIPYFQSLETTGFTQGRSREVADGTKWLQLGHCN